MKESEYTPNDFFFLEAHQRAWLDRCCNRTFNDGGWKVENSEINIYDDFKIDKYTQIFNALSFSINTIHGNFTIKDTSISQLPMGLPKIINGDFKIFDNHNLTSITSSTHKVLGDFYCCHNSSLQTMIGGPKEVYGICTFSHNNLNNCEGFPEKSREFWINGNKITSLKGIGGEVKGKIYASIEEINFLNSKNRKNIGDEVIKGTDWNLILAMFKDTFSPEEWNLITDKPDDATLEKLIYEHRGKIKTRNFGI